MENQHCHFREMISACRQLVHQYPNERIYKILLLSIAAYWSFNRFILPVTGETLFEYYKRKGINILQHLPKIGPKIKEQVEITKKTINDDLMKVYADEKFLTELPNGKPKDEILEMVKMYQKIDHIDWDKGRMSGAVYVDYSNNDQLDLMRDVNNFQFLNIHNR